MKIAKIILFALIAFCFSATVNAQNSKKKVKVKTTKSALKYQCPMKCEGEKTYAKNGKCPVCGMQMKPTKAIKAQAKYQCPMKCEGEKIYTKAGRCPVCNMNLKEMSSKKNEGEHKGHKHQ